MRRVMRCPGIPKITLPDSFTNKLIIILPVHKRDASVHPVLPDDVAPVHRHPRGAPRPLPRVVRGHRRRLVLVLRQDEEGQEEGQETESAKSRGRRGHGVVIFQIIR